MIRFFLRRFIAYKIQHTFQLRQVRLQDVQRGAGGEMYIDELAFQVIKSTEENGVVHKSIRSHHRDIRHNPFPEIEIEYVQMGEEIQSELWAYQRAYSIFILIWSIVMVGFSIFAPLLVGGDIDYPWFFPFWGSICAFILMLSWRWVVRIVYTKHMSSNLIEQAYLRYVLVESDPKT